MNKLNFAIDGYRQELWIEPQGINGQGDFVNPFLVIPLHLNLYPPNGITPFMLFTIEAVLCFKGFKHSTSETMYLSNRNVPLRQTGDKHTYIVEGLKFPMNQERIAMIEQHRTGDAYFTLNLKFHYGKYSLPPNENTLPQHYQKFIEYYETAFPNIYSVTINKSQWIEQILPSLGYKAFKLIEIPVESQFFPQEYRTSVAELDEAKKYYLNNDYDKVVAHCRSALEPFKDKVSELKKHLSEEKANWFEKITVNTNTWLNEIMKATKALSSETTHHIPTFGHFDKGEAEIIYTITVAIIGYIGRLP